MVPDGLTVTQPYKGSWQVFTSLDGQPIGFVNGDAVIGFTARDSDDHIIGSSYPSAEAAMVALTVDGAWLS